NACCRAAGGALRVQELRISVKPPGRKRVPRGTRDEVPALQQCGTQLGAQLLNPVIGEHRPQPVNRYVRLAVPPGEPQGDQDVEDSSRELGGDTSRRRG